MYKTFILVCVFLIALPAYSQNTNINALIKQINIYESARKSEQTQINLMLVYYKMGKYYKSIGNNQKAFEYYLKERDYEIQKGNNNFDFDPELYIETVLTGLTIYSGNLQILNKALGKISRYHDLRQISKDLFISRCYQPGDYGLETYAGFIVFWKSGGVFHARQKKIFDISPYTPMEITGNICTFKQKHHEKLIKELKYRIKSNGNIEEIK